MKTRLLVVMLMGCVLAGGLGWYFSQSSAPEDASTTAETKISAALPAPGLPSIKLPVKVPAPIAQVEAPVMAPAPVAATPADTTSAANEPQPQADLKSCVAQTITLLQARDLVGLVKTIMPPTAYQQMIDAGQATDTDSVAAQVRAKYPTIEQDMTDLLHALQSVQGQDAEMNQDGTQAVYHLATPIGRFNDITFIQQNGKWYFQ
jgi:hypothetical protein